MGQRALAEAKNHPLVRDSLQLAFADPSYVLRDASRSWGIPVVTEEGHAEAWTWNKETVHIRLEKLRESLKLKPEDFNVAVVGVKRQWSEGTSDVLRVIRKGAGMEVGTSPLTWADAQIVVHENPKDSRAFDCVLGMMGYDEESDFKIGGKLRRCHNWGALCGVVLSLDDFKMGRWREYDIEERIEFSVGVQLPVFVIDASIFATYEIVKGDEADLLLELLRHAALKRTKNRIVDVAPYSFARVMQTLEQRRAAIRSERGMYDGKVHLVVCGPSRSGKSTLLRFLFGLEKSSAVPAVGAPLRYDCTGIEHLVAWETPGSGGMTPPSTESCYWDNELFIYDIVVVVYANRLFEGPVNIIQRCRELSPLPDYTNDSCRSIDVLTVRTKADDAVQNEMRSHEKTADDARLVLQVGMVREVTRYLTDVRECFLGSFKDPLADRHFDEDKVLDYIKTLVAKRVLR